MRRRSRASGKPVKSPGRHATGPKARKALTVSASAGDPQEQFERLKRERDEAREQQTATAEILRVIRTSPADVQPVFETIVRNAVSLCGSLFANVFRFDGQQLHFVASHNVGPSYVDLMQRKYPMRPDLSQISGRVLLAKSVVRLEDVLTDPNYDQRFPLVMGWRRMLGVPMLREDELLGVIVVGWAEPGPVPQIQEELLKTFAAQAVIAIENTRLLGELRESLEQQTAMADVLGVISSSSGELQPVFDTMLAKATELCESSYGAMWLPEADGFRNAAFHGALPEAFKDQWRGGKVIKPTPDLPLVRAAKSRKPIQVADMRESRAYVEGAPLTVTAVDVGGIRTLAAVPMLKEDEFVGAIVLYRREVRPFTDKQIELASNFAKQAVIAIENTRLLNELRQRTDDLSESLEQQTATVDILRVIASSPDNTQPVFEAIVNSGLKLFPGALISIAVPVGDQVTTAAIAQPDPRRVDSWRRRFPFPLTREYMHGIAILDAKVVDIPDVANAPVDLMKGAQNFLASSYRAITIIPMIRGASAIGALSVVRIQPGPLSAEQLALLKAFASQAVIAIENTRLLNELRQRTDDLSESLEQQTATSEVLGVISSSPGELEPVFKAMLENGTHLCEAKFGIMWLREGDKFRCGALHNVPPQFAESRRREPVITAHAESPLGRAARTKQVIHVADIRTEPGYAESRPLRDLADLGGARTLVVVPMLKDDELVGVIAIYRQEVRPFNDKQIALLTGFAAQAVIAIENTRLLSELRESLEQQTATAEVLQVISSSPGALEPVFEAMLANAVRICDATFGNLWLRKGEGFRLAATHGSPAAYRERLQGLAAVGPGTGTAMAGVVKTRRAVQIADLAASEGYRARDPLIVASVEHGGTRTLIAVPMFKDDELIGTIAIYRQEVRAFTDKQIELVSNFAAQAVIAIENARLLSELRESLQQQTATADVLKVISRSTFDLQAVLDALVESACRLCEAEIGTIRHHDGTDYRLAATFGCAPEWRGQLARYSNQPDRGSVFGRTIVEGRTVHIPDVLADPEFARADIQKLMGFRAALGVPLVREGRVFGVMNLFRSAPRSFSQKQIELVETFADQAVIAIENARLVNELRESLQQQTATADVLKVISRSTFDLQAVLDTLVESAARLCEADNSFLFRSEDGKYVWAASHGFPGEYLDYMRDRQLVPERGTATGRAALDGKIVHIPDVFDDSEYTWWESQKVGKFRSVLAVPLMRESVSIGVLGLTRTEPRAFTKKQIELLATFADQAVIAIENVRLFESVEARTRELAQSLENLRAAQNRLVQTEKLASLGQLTAGIAHEIKNPLNFVNNFSGVSAEMIDELQDVLGGLPIDGKARTEINELTATLRANLDKVVQHGKRADAIVKNMLLHSRQGSEEHRPVEINAIVEESLNLAYHGARAEKQGFNITLERSLDPAAGEVDVFPQDITRVLLNLISNGFYAATKRKALANNKAYEPTLAAATRNLGDSVEIRIRDNGTGIPPEVKEKMFDPFFTTKPAGDGTGLGLSISHDIIVKQHSGSIEVDTKPGEYTEFRIVLPRTAAFLAREQRDDPLRRHAD